MKKLYVFDLDGVLINSKENMRKSWESVQDKFDIDNEFEEYFSLIGRPFQDILTLMGITENQESIKMIYDNTSLVNLNEVEIYDGVVETLNKIKDMGAQTAIVTSKSWERTEKVLMRLPIFDYVGCPNKKFRGKPAPDHLLSAMAFCNVDVKDTCYIGDMEPDYECAQRAGVDFIFAEYGYGDIECKNKITSIKSLV